MKKPILVSLLIAMSPLAFADSNIAGTYERPPPPVNPNRPTRAPIVKVVIIQQGKSVVVHEFWPDDVPADHFDCDPDGTCARWSRGRKGEEVKIFIDKGDVVITTTMDDRTKTTRRYHLSADGKTLSTIEFMGSPMSGLDFQRSK